MATSIAVQSSGDSPENHAKIAGKSHASVYDIVTERILAELEKGEVPWRKPWRTLPPANLVSKKPYRGINFFLLSLAGYGSQYWLTYRQAQALGGNVRKGEHGRFSFALCEGVYLGDGEPDEHYWLRIQGRIFDPTSARFR